MRFKWYGSDGSGQRVVAWFCPGCQQAHQVPVNPGPERGWDFSGTEESPTLHPSLKVYGRGNPPPATCHSFLRDGRMQFLGDCLHALAGQTVEVGEWPGWLL